MPSGLDAAQRPSGTRDGETGRQLSTSPKVRIQTFPGATPGAAGHRRGFQRIPPCPAGPKTCTALTRVRADLKRERVDLERERADLERERPVLVCLLA